MRMHFKAQLVTLAVGATGVATAAAGPLIGMTAAQAAPPAPRTVFVSTHGPAATDGDHGPVFGSINSAVAAVAAGGTVVVESGSYHEDVAVTKPLTLKGEGHATIDASHLINGIKVTASQVKVSGFTVENAIGEGILLENSTFSTIKGNRVHSNNTGVRLKDPVPNKYAFCQPLAPGVANDCGEGIHLLGSSHNVIQDNSVFDNAGGILLTDETGPTSHNLISGNRSADNHTACGIVLAGHNPKAAPGGVPAPTAAGIFANTVIKNVVTGNGLQATGGAGVQLATALPGGAVYDNTVSRNDITGNGHSGVTLHSHAPGQDLNGNVVTANRIGTNDLNGDNDFEVKDPETTGVLVGTVAPVSITIRDNVISRNHFGIFTTGPVTATGEHQNIFHADAVAVSTN
jgi:parallel beta-helix repeat protein